MSRRRQYKALRTRLKAATEKLQENVVAAKPVNDVEQAIRYLGALSARYGVELRVQRALISGAFTVYATRSEAYLFGKINTLRAVEDIRPEVSRLRAEQFEGYMANVVVSLCLRLGLNSFRGPNNADLVVPVTGGIQERHISFQD